MSDTPCTAVIGAGISGLTTIKNLSDAGILYDCFESSDRVGGNWAFRNPNGHSSAYRSLHIDSSREVLSLKDFPMRGDDLPDFPHHSHVKDYLDGFPLYKRMFVPGLDDLIFIGFAQTMPSLFPLVERQARLAAAYLAGIYRPPSPAEMTEAMAADQRRYTAHFTSRPRHTQQIDYFSYERDIRKHELPAGRRRVAKSGPVKLAGRAARATIDTQN